MRVAGSGVSLLVIGTALSCSSSSTSGTGPDPSKKLDTLSSTEVQSLCDWTAKDQGGYGTMIVCDAGQGSLEVPADRATCVTDVTPHWSQTTCTSTVGDWMTCAQWGLANVCATTQPAKPAACIAIDVGCFGGDDSVTATDAGTD
jgi:hypothetical protein